MAPDVNAGWVEPVWCGDIFSLKPKQVLCIFQTGPVRLFVPYKRKKKESESGSPSPTVKKMRAKGSVSASPLLKEGMCY